MKKYVILICFAILLVVLTGCSSSYEIGSVIVVSNGIEYEPHKHILHSGSTKGGGYLSASGLPFSLEDISKSLSEIQNADDVQVVIGGDDASTISYSLYDDSFGKIYEYEKEYISPDKAGIYLLCVDVTWSKEKKGLNTISQQPGMYLR